MTEMEWVIGLLALIAVLLFLIWMALRFAIGQLAELSSSVHGFIHDYETINNFKERKQMWAEGKVDQEMTEVNARLEREQREKKAQ